MAIDNAVKNQKVFVSLAGYTTLVNEYQRVCAASGNESRRLAHANNDLSGYQLMVARRQALEFVFRTLDLPVSI